jgi:hypothetical protein
MEHVKNVYYYLLYQCIAKTMYRRNQHRAEHQSNIHLSTQKNIHRLPLNAKNNLLKVKSQRTKLRLNQGNK